MNKFFFVLIFLIVWISMLPAETVLLCMNNNYPIYSEKSSSTWVKNVINAFEDGAMEAVFDSGHIVTNSFINESRMVSQKKDITNENLSQAMGNATGADYIIFFEVVFPDTDIKTTDTPVFKTFSMFSKYGKEIFKEKKTSINLNNAKGSDTIFELFVKEGNSAACEMLNHIKD